MPLRASQNTMQDAALDLRLSSEVFLVTRNFGLLLDLVEVQVRNGGVLAIDDLDQLLEGGTLGLDVHEEHEGELKSDPALKFH